MVTKDITKFYLITKSKDEKGCKTLLGEVNRDSLVPGLRLLMKLYFEKKLKTL